jgi:RNA polymerase sigma-70 factor (ECF subfamily)
VPPRPKTGIAPDTAPSFSSLAVFDDAEITPEAERELIRQAQGGDEEAFGNLMRRHYETTFRLVHSVLRDEHGARDVCQEVWLTVWKNLGSFRGDAKFSTWLHPIATRRAIDHLRRHRRWFSRFLPFASAIEADREQADERFAAAPEPTDDATPRDELEARERQARFERAIAALPPKHRAVLALREIQGLSYDEIASHLGIARGTVMSRLFHARRHLAQKLGDLPCD